MTIVYVGGQRLFVNTVIGVRGHAFITVVSRLGMGVGMLISHFPIAAQQRVGQHQAGGIEAMAVLIVRDDGLGCTPVFCYGRMLILCTPVVQVGEVEVDVPMTYMPIIVGINIVGQAMWATSVGVVSQLLCFLPFGCGQGINILFVDNLKAVIMV